MCLCVCVCVGGGVWVRLTAGEKDTTVVFMDGGWDPHGRCI